MVVLSTELTPELVAEGWARELVHAIQNRRKDLDCEYTDRIAVGIETESEEITKAARDFRDYICARRWGSICNPGPSKERKRLSFPLPAPLKLYVKRLPAAGQGSRP